MSFAVVALAVFTVVLSWRARRAAKTRVNIAVADKVLAANSKVLREEDRMTKRPSVQRLH